MKKIVFASMLFFLALPFSTVLGAYDYTKGYLDESSNYTTKSVNSLNNLHYVTDNNLSTGGYSSSYSAGIEFNFPERPDLTAIYIKSSRPVQVTIYQGGSASGSDTYYLQQGYNTLNYTNVSKVNLKMPVYNNTWLYEVEFFSSHHELITIDPVENLSETHTHNEVNLSWQKPIGNGITGFLIKQNGVQIAKLPNTAIKYKVSNLEPETTYNFEVITLYEELGKQSDPVAISVTTDEEPKIVGEITNLSATPKYNRVDLSWTLPKSNFLQHVNIYRDSNEIFETNGTYFNDLTVQPDTTYNYKVSTTSTENVESPGVTKTVKTPLPPPPKIEGGQFEVDEETGDYIYRWTEPTTGQVKVYVGGKEYRTVNAADQQIIIPKEDMKLTLLGSPDVYLVPIDPYGQEGGSVKPPSSTGGTGGALDSVKIPFSVNELLKTSAGLFLLVGSIVLLALAFLLVPKLRALLVNPFSKNKKEKLPGERRTKAQREREEREKRERESKEFKEPRERDIREIAKESKGATISPRERVNKVERVTTRGIKETRFKASRERLTRSQRISNREPRQPRIREREERLSRAERVSR